MQTEAAIHEHHPDTDSIDVFGFWLYIMSDCILFACLFATFIVLHSPGLPGPDLKQYIELPYVFIETMFLLMSNFTFCLAVLNLYQQKIHRVQIWLGISFLLGACFIFMELTEFFKLYHEGFGFEINGKASSFFTLVGTHGLHVTCGLIWILLLMIQLPGLKDGIARRRMTYLGLFWNFLDIVWIFVFTIVYLMGAL